MTFEVRDPNGWTGVEADTLEGARLACRTICFEGYELPLDIVPADRNIVIESFLGFDEAGRPMWRTTDAGRCYRNPARVVVDLPARRAA